MSKIPISLNHVARSSKNKSRLPRIKSIHRPPSPSPALTVRVPVPCVTSTDPSRTNSTAGVSLLLIRRCNCPGLMSRPPPFPSPPTPLPPPPLLLVLLPRMSGCGMPCAAGRGHTSASGEYARPPLSMSSSSINRVSAVEARDWVCGEAVRSDQGFSICSFFFG